MQQDLGIAARLEDRAVAHEIVAQLARVDEVAVVGHGDLAVGAIDQERLGVVQPALAGGRIARVADREVTGQRLERGFVERVRHVAHRAGRTHAGTVGGDDAGAFLAAVLQRVQAQVREVGRLGIAEDAEDAAFVLELIEHGSTCGSQSVPLKRRRSPRCRWLTEYFTPLCP